MATSAVTSRSWGAVRAVPLVSAAQSPHSRSRAGLTSRGIGRTGQDQGPSWALEAPVSPLLRGEGAAVFGWGGGYQPAAAADGTPWGSALTRPHHSPPAPPWRPLALAVPSQAPRLVTWTPRCPLQASPARRLSSHGHTCSCICVPRGDIRLSTPGQARTQQVRGAKVTQHTDVPWDFSPVHKTCLRASVQGPLRPTSRKPCLITLSPWPRRSSPVPAQDLPASCRPPCRAHGHHLPPHHQL